MADNQTPAGGHPDMDYAEHDATYNLFLVLTKWTIILTVIILVLMAYFLL